MSKPIKILNTVNYKAIYKPSKKIVTVCVFYGAWNREKWRNLDCKSQEDALLKAKEFIKLKMKIQIT